MSSRPTARRLRVYLKTPTSERLRFQIYNKKKNTRTSFIRADFLPPLKKSGTSAELTSSCSRRIEGGGAVPNKSLISCQIRRKKKPFSPSLHFLSPISSSSSGEKELSSRYIYLPFTLSVIQQVQRNNNKKSKQQQKNRTQLVNPLGTLTSPSQRSQVTVSSSSFTICQSSGR